MARVNYKMKFKQITFDKAKFLADWKEGAKKLIKNAAAEFAIYAEQSIPVDTGMAKSTLLGKVETIEGGMSTAERYLGLNDSPANINVSAMIKRTRKDADLASYWKNDFGITDNYKRTPFQGRQRGLYSFRMEGSKIIFSFFPSVRHYIYHENRWRSMERGRKAFQSYIELKKADYTPKLKKYYTIKYVGA